MVLGESSCPGRECLSLKRVDVLVERVSSWEWERGVGPGREGVVLGESVCPGRELLSWE